jgi:hypothetical protein
MTAQIPAKGPVGVRFTATTDNVWRTSASNIAAAIPEFERSVHL